MGEFEPTQAGRITVYTVDGETIARFIERRDHETVSFEEPHPEVAGPPGMPSD